jgi:transcription antitermination factor NusG
MAFSPLEQDIERFQTPAATAGCNLKLVRPGGSNNFSGDGNLLWYALHVRSRFERAVVRNLEGKGYEPFLPLCRRVRLWSDRIKHIELPLFPGYVFCRFDAAARLPILTIPGVNGVVGNGRNLLPVSESELNAIKTVLSSGNYYEACPFLAIGQRVRVEYGALQGVEGFVALMKNRQRLVISVEMLQRSVAVEVERECLRPIAKRGSSAVATAVSA